MARVADVTKRWSEAVGVDLQRTLRGVRYLQQNRLVALPRPGPGAAQPHWNLEHLTNFLYGSVAGDPVVASAEAAETFGKMEPEEELRRHRTDESSLESGSLTRVLRRWVKDQNDHSPSTLPSNAQFGILPGRNLRSATMALIDLFSQPEGEGIRAAMTAASFSIRLDIKGHAHPRAMVSYLDTDGKRYSDLYFPVAGSEFQQSGAPHPLAYSVEITPAHLFTLAKLWADSKVALGLPLGEPVPPSDPSGNPPPVTSETKNAEAAPIAPAPTDHPDEARSQGRRTTDELFRIPRSSSRALVDARAETEGLLSTQGAKPHGSPSDWRTRAA